MLCMAQLMLNLAKLILNTTLCALGSHAQLAGVCENDDPDMAEGAKWGGRSCGMLCRSSRYRYTRGLDADRQINYIEKRFDTIHAHVTNLWQFS